MKRASILVVEDNNDMRRAVVSHLRDVGFQVHQAVSVEEAFNNKLYENTDLALLDISLPGKTGLEMTTELKSMGYEGSIIGITARDTVDDRVIGLETGMTDYIVKPFDLRELDARINAQLRILGVHHDLQQIRTKTFRIEPKRHKFFANGKQIKLTLVEFRLMIVLMQNNHAVAKTQDLIEAAWGHEAALSSPPIRIHISNLRRKIDDENYSIIQTVPGVGYMLAD